MKQEYDIIIVGAGISGLTLAERYASIGKSVLVVEARNVIGGNCHDFINEAGILVSAYGPHYFHTNYENVWEYVSRFTSWHPYEHRVISHIEDKQVPVPVNRTTINTLFNESLQNEQDVESWIIKNREPIEHPANAEEAVLARMGRRLYELLFKGYTQKQWDKDPRDLGAEVTNRIPLRFDDDDRYFTDAHQALPSDGYTKLFERMVDNTFIKVVTGTPWESIKDSVAYREKLFFTGKIDNYFSEKFGALEYRSLRFEFETLDQELFQKYAQENYPSLDVPYTRIVEYKLATGQQNPKTTISREYPTWEGEPYYPVPSIENQDLYKKYQSAAQELEKEGIYFVGRLANYKYFNMDQAFKNVLELFETLEGYNKDQEKNTAFNFVIRDDDLNFFSTPEDILNVYDQVFKQGVPVSFATIPFVTAKSDLHSPIQSPDGEYAISGNTELVEYIKNNSLIEIMQHGCNHEIKQGVYEYMQKTGLFEDTARGKAELEKAFNRPVTVFVAPHDQFSTHALLALENAKLNIIRGKGSRNFLPRIGYVKNFFKMMFHKIKSPYAFPKTVDLGYHKEAFGMRIEFGREYLFSALHYIHEQSGNFILVNHINDFDENKKQLMLELIEEARKLGAVFVPASKLFNSSQKS